MLKVLKIVKEILIVVSIWSLFMLFVFGALQFDSVLLSLAMFGFLVFYRVQKNKNMDYLKPFRKFFWIGMFLLMIAAFAFSPATPKKTSEKQEVAVKSVKKEEVKPVAKPKETKKEKPKPVKKVEKEKRKEKPEPKIKEKPKPKQKPKKELKNQTAFEKFDLEAEIKRISSKKMSKTKKFHAIIDKVYEIKLTKKEVLYFTKYLLKEHEKDNYIKKLKDEKYALKNIAISYLVSYSTTSPSIDAYSFDFHQNSKYIYRDVDTPTSHDTMENKHQLKKMRPYAIEYVKSGGKPTTFDKQIMIQRQNEEAMTYLLQIDKNLKRISVMIGEMNSDTIRNESWREEFLGLVQASEYLFEKVRNSASYESFISKNAKSNNEFKQLELKVIAVRMIYVAIIENDKQKMDRAFYILNVQIPELANKVK